MTKLQVHVTAPRPEHDGRVRVIAQVRSPALGEREIWFSVDERARECLTESADPFVLALLAPAMQERIAVHVTGATVSPSLLRNLEGFQQAWRTWRGSCVVDVIAEEEREAAGSHLERPALVAFSGGIDSAFTAYRHARGMAGRQAEDVRAGVMVHGFDIALNDAAFDGALDRSRRMLDSLGLELYTIATNVREVLPSWEDDHGLAIAASLHLLSGGYGAGLIASSATFEAPFEPWGSNPLTDPMLSSEAFRIVHDGCGTNRLEKLRALTEWDEAMRDLRFCWQGPSHDRNCGRCRKCTGVAAMFRVLDVEPRCFDEIPTTETIVRAQRDPAGTNTFSRQYARHTYEAATAAGIDEPWVRAMRQRLRRDRYRRLLEDISSPVTLRLARRRGRAR